MAMRAAARGRAGAAAVVLALALGACGGPGGVEIGPPTPTPLGRD